MDNMSHGDSCADIDAMYAEIDRLEDEIDRQRALNEGVMGALVDLLDQLEGIGVPDWHGAEGLSLDAARTAIAKAQD